MDSGIMNLPKTQRERSAFFSLAYIDDRGHVVDYETGRTWRSRQAWLDERAGRAAVLFQSWPADPEILRRSAEEQSAFK